MKFQIREFQDSDPVSEITGLLHRAYKPLADAGLRYVASYQDDDRTLRRIKTGKCFVLTAHKAIVGTITYYPADRNRTDWPPLYIENRAAHFGQFAIEPTLQKHGFGSMLMDHVEQYAIENNMLAMYFDTSEQASDLIKYYEKRGYKFADYHQWADTNYRSVVMKKTLSGPSEK